ncbi:hypothetical protein DFP73DRAFT_551689 [Morchella snyderi]|nr:hypothetical protein DFP73DRAFT_551689 [Morchella snyderi]
MKHLESNSSRNRVIHINNLFCLNTDIFFSAAAVGTQTDLSRKNLVRNCQLVDATQVKTDTLDRPVVGALIGCTGLIYWSLK